MNRVSIAIGLGISFVVCTTAQAQSICRVYEYAELKDMSHEKLLEMRCNYYSAMRELLEIALINAKAGKMAASNRDLADGNRCAQEMDRMERVLENKYGVKKLPACPNPIKP